MSWSAAAPTREAAGGGGTGTGDLILPVVAVGAAGVLAAYAYTRRRRRARTRTTPGGVATTVVPLAELGRQAQQSLVDTDDCVRTSAEELGLVTARFGDEAVKPYAEALAFARSGLAAAFRLRQRLDDPGPESDDERRQLLEEVVALCTEAGRRLDTEAAGFDQLRALERDAPAALEYAETRFRRLATRTPAAEATLRELRERYAPSASAPVAGYVEQAKDRLLFATVHLNRARQSLDRGEEDLAASYLRAAEGAVDQAAVLVDGVDRLAGELAAAEQQLPAAISVVEGGLAKARGEPEGTAGGSPELPGRVAQAESVLADVQRPLSAAGAQDPLDALRRVARVGADFADGSVDHVLLPARSSVAIAADFVTTHRGAVGWEARTRLAEAERCLSGDLGGAQAAEGLAQRARVLAEQDVRGYGHPLREGAGAGAGGALLGGILLAGGGPASYGGWETRGRREVP
ncbi:hypothetical protein ACFWP7_32425 [Streptomyces sp. NPDC058470]|uniref:hypothetical protein n=1 Tax=Streptomyces sp. NPDC058470 TaxID=3346515 RepID=UPI003665DB1D